jgi:hypothetical protein
MTPAAKTMAVSQRLSERIILLAAGIFYAAGSFVPWGWPSVDGYPAIERFIDPLFLANDFYTNTTTAYNVDTLLAATLGWIQKTTGVHYDLVMAALNLVRCLIWPFVLFQFFKSLSGDRKTALIGALVGAGSLYAVPNLFAWGWLWGDPSTAMFAVVLIAAAWGLFLGRRPALGMLLFSAALLVHPLMAVHGGIFTALIFFVDYRRDEKWRALRSPAAWLSVLLFGGLFAAQYVMLGATPDEELPIEAYTHILAYVRHPTDFIPSLFPVSDWIAGVLSAATAILIVWKMPANFAKGRLVTAGLLSYGVICVCGYLFVELYPVRFFVELIPFRYVIVGAPLMLFAYAAFLAAELRDGRIASFLVLSALFFAYPIAARMGSVSLIVLAMILVWTAFRIFSGRRAIAFLDKQLSRFTPGAVLMIIGAALLALSPAAIYVRRHELVMPRVGNQHPLYAWATRETLSDAVFLVDQNGKSAFTRAIDPQRMRLVGRRAVVASKDFPFLDKDIAPWNERWQAALGGGAPRFVSRADAAALAEIAARFRVDYVVRDAPLADDPRFQMAHVFASAAATGEIYVYAVRR